MSASTAGERLLARNGWADRSSGEAGYKVCCRGGLRLLKGAEDLTPRSKKGRALLAILAAEQRPLPRTKIIDLLWSDRQEEQARASLRTLLADLREQLGENFSGVIIAERDQVALAPSTKTDLTEAALGRADAEPFEGLDHLDAELDEWLRLERERWRNAPVAGSDAASRLPSKARPWRVWVIAGALVFLLGAAAITWYSNRSQPPRQQTIAILAAQGPASDEQRLFTESLAEGVREDLRLVPQAEVIGEASSRQFATAELDPRRLYERFQIDLVVTTSIRQLGAGSRLVARAVDAGSGSELWSTSYELTPPRLISARETVVADLAGRVRDTLSIERDGSTARWTRGRAGDQLAEARRLLRANGPQEALQARNILLDLTTADPDNVLALAALAEATIRSSDHPNAGGPLPLADARRQARAYALRAIRLAPQVAAGYGALAASHFETSQAIAPLERAVALEPSNYAYRLDLARAYEYQDRYTEAFEHLEPAARLEPLLVAPVIRLVSAGVYLGRLRDVRNIVEAFTARAPAVRPQDVAYARGYLAYSNDSFGECVQRLRPLASDGGVPRTILLICLDALNEKDLALQIMQSEDSLRYYGISGDMDGLIRKARQLGPEFWRRNSESVGAAELLAAAGRHDVLLELFDQSYNSVEEFDREGGRMTQDPQALIVAMQRSGRRLDAHKLRAMLLRNARRQRVHVGLRPYSILNEASAAMAAGDRERAIVLLEACAPTCLYSEFLRDQSETALFSPLKGNPRFDHVFIRYRERINQERQRAGLRPLPLA